MSNSPDLKATIQEHVEYQREARWRSDGVPEALIRLSRQSGVDAADMQVFESMSLAGWLIIIPARNPRRVPGTASSGRIQAGDTCIAFLSGRALLLRGPSACAAFYRTHGLAWPYNGAGQFVGRG